MQLFDELSLHVRGVRTGTESLEGLLKGGLCHLAAGSWVSGVFFFRMMEIGTFFHYLTEISTLISPL